MSARAIVALDTSTLGAARAIVATLGDAGDYYKVGCELYTMAGPSALEMLLELGKDVFLDLKFHDIPNTVREAARGAASLGARLITVHASGGRTMLEAAVQGALANGGCKVLAVTVLTSLDAAALGAAWGRESLRVQDEVLRLADAAMTAGAHGVVCGGTEARLVRERFGHDLRLLVPGVRLPGTDRGDQARIATPSEAAAAGADFVVVGRTVTAAADPRAAMQIVREMLA